MSFVDKPQKQSWWARQSRGRRILYLGLALLLVLAIALGVGLGVGLNQGGDDDDDSGDNGSSPSSPSQTSTPTTLPPTPNGTFTVNSTWQIILLKPITIDESATKTDPDVDVWDIDLFTNSYTTIEKLKSLGKTVICYFSAGSYENFRPDSGNFTDADKGKELDGWPGEKWLNTSSANVRSIMTKRIALAREKGCDAIDPDNMDGYDNKNGLGLTNYTAIDYMQFLSSEAQKQNLSIGLKNAGAIVPSVINITDFVVNEQCIQFGECDNWSSYIEQGKPVFNIEYPDDAPTVSSKILQQKCSTDGDAENSNGFSKVIKKMNLDGWVEYCDGNTYNTTLNNS